MLHDANSNTGRPDSAMKEAQSEAGIPCPLLLHLRHTQRMYYTLVNYFNFMFTYSKEQNTKVYSVEMPCIQKHFLFKPVKDA